MTSKTSRRKFIASSALAAGFTLFGSAAAGALTLLAVSFLVTMTTVSASAQSAAIPTATPAIADPCAETKAQLVRVENRLNDWPALGRYHDANTKLATPAKNELRVVFMGDSITDSWDDPRFGGFFPGQPYIDRGISGQTTPQMLIRFHADVIALQPKVVVILAGTNDIAGNTGPMSLEAIEDNLTSMAELARANKIRVVLASVLPISDYGKTKAGQPIIRTVQRPPAQIKALNDWIRKYSADNHATFLDYYSAMVDDKGFLKDELSEDGLHPNQKGYEIMAPLAERAISLALKHK
jgi:lysophospholipase L1-like esterase